MTVAGFRLAIDLGTCHTVAVARRDGQPPRVLLLDGTPTMPSGVFAAADGSLHTGRDAARLAAGDPGRFEPYPKRRVDEGTVLLGESEVPVASLLAAVLRRVAHEAWQGGVDAADATVLTHPAGWGPQRRAVLVEAARLAGLGAVTLVAEPVAAATYCVDALGGQVAEGQSLAVFDFGGGTLDLTVVRRESGRLVIVATGGLPELGGLDIDAALVAHLGPLVAARDPDLWRRLGNPTDAVDLRERASFWSEVRAAKEMLSRNASAPVALPRRPDSLHLTRDELEQVAGPLINRAIAETGLLLRRLRLSGPELAGVLLVGGSSRIPLVATRLHSRLGVAPTVPEQPELPVAFGALLAATPTTIGGGDPPAPPGAGAAPAGAAPADLSWPSSPPAPPVPAPIPPAVPILGTRRRRIVAAMGSAVLVAALAGGLLWANAGGIPGDGGTPESQRDGTSITRENGAPPAGELYANPVTLTWWHNASQDGPGKIYWEKVAADFSALHPTVTIEVEGIETNQLQRTRLPAALLSNDPPDIFQARGGGELREQVEADYLKDITDEVQAEVANIGSAAEIWQADGKQYGLPYRMGIEGIWYNKDMFAAAGITAPPTTFDELNDAVTKLKATNVIPIAVGAGDKWPAAHWWYNFALRACSVDTLKKASVEPVFDDPCFVKAGEDLKAFIDTEPFQPNFIGTPGQSDPTSASGLLANGRAAMELMGDWNKGTLETVAEDPDAVTEFLGWFPVPALAGAAGDPKAALGGGDGFSCARNAPAECVEFLKYIVSPEVQKGYAETGTGLPVAKGAEAGVTDPALSSILEATTSATYVQLWLDTAFGSTVGNAMNDAIVAIFAGSGTPEQVVEAMKSAASK